MEVYSQPMGIKKKHPVFKRIKTYSINEIFDFLRNNQFTPVPVVPDKPWESRFTKQYYVDSDGNRMSVRRARVFMDSGTDCKCGLRGSYFALEQWKDGGLHLDLYAKDDVGDDVLKTIDHVFPESKGGASSIENYEPMCKVCNEKKADKI